MALTNAGYVKRDNETIKSEIIKELELNNTEFLNLPADIQNNLIDSAIPIIMQFENIAAEVLNGYGTEYANDYIFLNIANSLGLTKNNEVKAQVELKFEGTPGTYIPENTEVEGFKTSESLTLNTSGVGFVIAYSDNDTYVEAENLTQINSIINDNLKVTNPEASIKKQDEETIGQLRERVRVILRSSRKGAIEYAFSKIKGIEGVNPQLVKFRYLNFNYETKENNIDILKNVNGIEAIVGGGDANQIAGVLFDSFLETAKLISYPSNNETNRKIETFIKYFNNDILITFTRPKNLNLNFKIIFTFKSLLVSSASLEGFIVDKFTNLINEWQLGTELNKYTLDMFLIDLLNEKGIKTQQIIKMQYIININDELINFDTEGFLECIQHDTYLTLNSLTIETNTTLS